MALTKATALVVQSTAADLRGAGEALLTAGLDINELQRLASEGGELDIEEHRDTDGLKKTVKAYLAAHDKHEKAVAAAKREL